VQAFTVGCALIGVYGCTQGTIVLHKSFKLTGSMVKHRPLSQVGSRRKQCPGRFDQDGMGSIPAIPQHEERFVLSTKQNACLY
jgi:hypothetical protein